MFKYHTIALTSHASKVMLKILQARLLQYMNRELPDGLPGFRKGRGTEMKLPSLAGYWRKWENYRKNIYFCFTDYGNTFDCVDHNKLWKILKQMGTPDHFTCLLRNLYAGQEATVRTRHGTTDWFQIGKGVCQSCILSTCLFNLYAEFSSVQSFSRVHLFVTPWILVIKAILDSKMMAVPGEIPKQRDEIFQQRKPYLTYQY